MNIRSMILTSLFTMTAMALATPEANAATAKDSTSKKSASKKKKASAKTSAKKFKYLTPVSATKPAGSGKRLKAGGKAVDEKLSRDIVFDGSTVNGKYHSAGEAVAKVEQEKKLNDLIGMRRDFKDRLSAEKERLLSNRSVNTEEDGAQTAN